MQSILIATAAVGAIGLVVGVLLIFIGKKFGAGLSCKATILGGSILVVIGLVIFIRGLLGI